MRVLLTSYAEKTHFLGLVPLGWALQTAGHEVRVASQPELTDTVAGSGLTSVPLGRDHRLYRLLAWAREHGQEEPDFDPGEVDQQRWDWDRLREGHRDYVEHWWRVVNEPMLADLVRYCRAWRPDLVVWETSTFAGALAASACGAAHGRFTWSVDILGRTRRRYLELMNARPPEEREDPLASWLADRAGRFGARMSEELVTGQFTVDQTPEALRLDPDPDRIGMRYVPYGGRAVVPGWLRTPPARPRVCLTLGTSATDRLGGYAVPVQDLLDALADLDVEVVATLPAEEQAKLDRIPANARLVDYVPLDALLPTCSAVINHGGPGTVFTALRHGVPQLAVAHHTLDAPLLSLRLAEQGLGFALASGEATGRRVRALLERLLEEPSFRERAEAVRAEQARAPSPADAVRALERRVERHREAGQSASRTPTNIPQSHGPPVT